MEPLKPLVHIRGPSNPGPGERSLMLERAAQVFADSGIDPPDIVRINVPGRGQSAASEAPVRPEVEPVIPALQSGSLFGGRTGVMIMDAHLLRSPEAGAVTELLQQVTGGERQVVLVSSGRLPAPLATHARKFGQVISVRKVRERDAADWLRAAVGKRSMRMRADAQAALLERFGSDVGALAQALDQLSVIDSPITADLIRDRFRNRPDEPIWRFTDALGKGAVDDALRRLHDLLTHSHPLVLLAAIENDLRRRALAAAAPDIETFAAWAGYDPGSFPARKNWQAGKRMTEDNLTKAVDALLRADATFKTMPEETHLVTLERLAVSLCYRYGR